MGEPDRTPAVSAEFPAHTIVTLRTRAGEFVGRTLVPDFQPPAEVLVWGIRTFALDTDSLGSGELEYREVMAYYLIAPVES